MGVVFQNSYIFLDCLRLRLGVKWCTIEEVKDKLTPPPTLTSFWSVRGVKEYESPGVMEKRVRGNGEKFDPGSLLYLLCTTSLTSLSFT